MVYLGIDVGFSAAVRSTGICVLDLSGATSLNCVHVKTAETLAAIKKLLAGRQPSAISLNGPLVPGETPAEKFILVNRYRSCEQLLSGGIFQKRCKPGPTNSPRGQALHQQATSIANVLKRDFPNTPIVEAFPNAFLGAMLPDTAFARPIRRGIKSDVFWKATVGHAGVMPDLLKYLFGGRSRRILGHACKLDDHDERAAFVCAITARAVFKNKSFLIKTPTDGTIALAPSRFIQNWARPLLEKRLAAA